jgi:bifunctional non-homologous end joining protein LigD
MPTKTLDRPLDVRAVRGLPQIDPIALATRADAFDDPEWLFEPKYDGFRGLLYASKLGCEIRSRRHFRFDGFDELCNRVARVLGAREVILDGEIVALDRKGKPVFRDLLRGEGFLAFAAFDILWIDGDDLRPLPLAERKRRLTQLLPADTGPLYKILTLEEHGRALFGAIKKMDLEGIVAKRKGDGYGPSTTWYEIRNQAYSQGEGRADVFRRRERARRADREV